MDSIHTLFAGVGAGGIDWALFTSTFALIFVAELPDKTAFATLLLSTTHNPLAVFFGASGAFLIQSIVAVAFGSVFTLLPERPVHIASGLLFLAFAVVMWRRKEEGEDADRKVAPASGRFTKSVVAAFLVIFIAEWGDLTQLATATLVAKSRAPLTVFLAATLSLWLVTAIGAIIGSKMKAVLNPRLLQKIAAAAMALVGIYLLSPFG